MIPKAHKPDPTRTSVAFRQDAVLGAGDVVLGVGDVEQSSINRVEPERHEKTPFASITNVFSQE